MYSDKEFDDLANDLNNQVEFHKQKIMNSDISLTEEVIKQVMLGIMENLDAKTAEAVCPILSAIGECLIELKATNDILMGELIEKNSPSPKNFEDN